MHKKLLLFFLAFFFFSSPSLASAQVKIMPMGDSITAGQYPCKLKPLLDAAGINYKFVGGQFTCDYHEGHSGWSTSDMAYGNGGTFSNRTTPNVTTMATKYTPDIVLLMLGTNDGIASLDPDSYAQSMVNLSHIISELQKANHSVQILLAKIPPFIGYDGVDRTIAVSKYNTKLESTFASRPGIKIVDQFGPYAGIPAYVPKTDSNLESGVAYIHPNANGADKIARKFLAAISGAVDPANTCVANGNYCVASRNDCLSGDLPQSGGLCGNGLLCCQRTTPSTTGILQNELDYWLDTKNVDAYLVWQYGYELGSNVSSGDKYTFYKGDPVCSILKAKAQSSPTKYIGVNVPNLAQIPTLINPVLDDLKNNCGVNIIRIWGVPVNGVANTDGIKAVLSAANARGIKVIIVLSDYSNSSDPILPGSIRTDPTQWYSGGYRTTHYDIYVRDLILNIGNNTTIYAYELANEPHCGGIAGCVAPYATWAGRMADLINNNLSAPILVSIGQKASENTTRGDSPGIGNPEDFRMSNSASSSITAASGHYYTDAEKLVVASAESIARSLGKKFYIGEANLNFSTTTILPPQNPKTLGFDPLKIPCNQTVPGATIPPNKEFAPLRPYPASPCDPLIPNDAGEGSPNALQSFACGKSLNPQGTFKVPRKIDVASLAEYPGDDNAVTGTYYRCQGTTDFVCAVKRTGYDITIDLAAAQLPIIGNTQDPLDDYTRANQYLDWYLNGTVQQSDQSVLDPNNPADIDRLINFSGPLKKLLPQSTLNDIHSSMTGQFNSNIGTNFHNSLVDDNVRLKNVWSQLFSQVPFASLEDTVSEITIGLIPRQQPGNTDGGDPGLQDVLTGEFDYRGRVITDTNTTGPNNITLTIRGLTGETADPRLYFPHLRNTNFLSALLSQISRPKNIGSHTNILPETAQVISDHQQPVTNDYLTGDNTRNTEINTFTTWPNAVPAPDPLIDYGGYDQRCELTQVRTNPGDELFGRQIKAHINYAQSIRYKPPPVPTTVPGQPACRKDMETCTGGGPGTNNCCDSTQDCQLQENLPCGGNTGYTCPHPWEGTRRCVGGNNQDIELATETRIAVYTKTPLIERIYTTLIGGADSFLRRFIPSQVCKNTDGTERPCTTDEKKHYIRQGAETFPASTAVGYSSSNNPDSPPVATGYTDLSTAKNTAAGNGSGGPLIYFARIGSLFDYFLGSGFTENFNLQKILRPEGFTSSNTGGNPMGNCIPATQLPTLPPSDPTCNDASNSTCHKNFSSPLLQQIFESAASFYHVPVSVLVGIMYNEGGLNPPGWNDARVLAASGPNCIDSTTCANVSTSGAAGPWQFLSQTWDNPQDRYGNAVIEAGIRDGRTPNRCNIIDSTFAAAKALSHGRSGAASYPNSNMCAGTKLNNVVGVSTSCFWNNSDIVTAARQYLGYCEGEKPFQSSLSCTRLGTPTAPFCDYCKVSSDCCTNPNRCYETRTLNIATCNLSISP